MGVLLLKIAANLLFSFFRVISKKKPIIIDNGNSKSYKVKKWQLFIMPMYSCMYEIIKDERIIDYLLDYQRLKLNYTFDRDITKVKKHYTEIEKFLKRKESSLYLESLAYDSAFTQNQGEMTFGEDLFDDYIYAAICAILGIGLLFHFGFLKVIFVIIIGIIIVCGAYITSIEAKRKAVNKYLYYLFDNFPLTDPSPMTADRPSDY